MIEAEVGTAVPLELMLPDGAENKGVQVFLQAEDGTDLAVLSLTHMARGRYTGNFTFTAAGYFYTDYLTYSDPTCQVEDLLYTRRSELYKVSPAIDLAASFTAVPAAVWAYPERIITNDLSALATGDEVGAAVTAVLSQTAKIQYVNGMSTTFNTITGEQEVLVWAEKDGNVVKAPGAGTVAVSNSAGSLIWSAAASQPNSDGIFRFVNPITVVGDANFYVTIGIVVDGALRTNIKTFFTVA